MDKKSFWKLLGEKRASLFLLLFVLILFLFFPSLWYYLKINFWYLSTLLGVFVLWAFLVKINLPSEYSPLSFGDWLSIFIFSGIYYVTWKEPKIFSFLFKDSISNSIFAFYDSRNFYFALLGWLGATSIFYALASLKYRSQDLGKKKISIFLFTLIMVGYAMYLNILVALVSNFFYR